MACGTLGGVVRGRVIAGKLMHKSEPKVEKFTVKPLTPARWGDFEELFGPRGACAGCWCTWWRLRRSDWNRGKGERNKERMRRIVEDGPPPGLIVYSSRTPIGWIAIGPRETYAALANSRVLKQVDERPVWSVTCFFVRKDHRRRGVTRALLEAAVQFAGKHGATIVEGYPVVPKKKDVPAVFAFTGLESAFRATGFSEAARRSPTRPIMRREI